MIYNEDFETLPREVLETLQLKRLQQVVQRVYHTVGYYKKSLDAAKISPDDIRSLDDLKKLPFITRQAKFWRRPAIFYNTRPCDRRVAGPAGAV